MTREDQKARLDRMVAAYKHNHNRLAGISADMRRKAEAITLEDRPKQRHNGRHKATWTGADERYFLDRFFEMEANRKREIEALSGKMQRQRSAIEQLWVKLGLNDLPELKGIPVVHPGIWLPR